MYVVCEDTTTKRNVGQLFVETKSEMSLTRGPLASTRGVGGGRLGILTAFSRRLNSQFLAQFVQDDWGWVK